MDIPIDKLINEVLAGSGRAIIAILIIVIAALVWEIKSQRAYVKDAYAKLDAERTQSLKIIDTMQEKFMDKTEGMIEKYHSSISSQQENTEKIKEMISTLIMFMTNKK